MHSPQSGGNALRHAGGGDAQLLVRDEHMVACFQRPSLIRVVQGKPMRRPAAPDVLKHLCPARLVLEGLFRHRAVPRRADDAVTQARGQALRGAVAAEHARPGGAEHDVHLRVRLQEVFQQSGVLEEAVPRRVEEGAALKAPPHVFVVEHAVEVEVEHVFSDALGQPGAEHVAKRRAGAPEPRAQGGLRFLRGKAELRIAHEDVELALGQDGRVRNHHQVVVHPLFVDAQSCLQGVLVGKPVGAADEARRHFAQMASVRQSGVVDARGVQNDAHVAPGAQDLHQPRHPGRVPAVGLARVEQPVVVEK